MIEQQLLQTKAIKGQTSFRNILREYLQHLFLTNFYKKAGSKNFLFKGGTALKLIFGSPRFSEDIDFSGIKNSINYERVLEDVLFDFSFEDIKISLEESKPTTGGHLAILKATLFGEELEIRNEISFRPQKFLVPQVSLISSEITPSYQVYFLNKKIMVSEKVQALISRHKPRDFFDLYFILRKDELRQELELKPEQRKRIISLMKSQNRSVLSRELSELLPKSFWPVIKNLPMSLKKELERSY